MRKLHRDTIEVPPCLMEFHHPEHNWKTEAFSKRKSEIHTRLEQMQGRRCAYCEGSLDTLGQHIEHFRRKNPAHFPELTFEWSNLYWSCGKQDSCGHHKDHGAGPYNVNDLIDPCADDPDYFLRFHAFGEISIRPGLSAGDQHRASETLRVFNLHPRRGRLRAMRRAAIAPYLYLTDQCECFSRLELEELLSNELAIIEDLPFSTAIRHVLTEPAP